MGFRLGTCNSMTSRSIASPQTTSISNLFVGVPAVLGSKGVEKILELNLSDDEKAQLQKSIAAVKELCETVDKLMA